MAYCRWGELDSDVYMWGADDGVVCSNCDVFGMTYDQAIAHLEQHRAEGLVVPEQAIQNLRVDRARDNLAQAVGKTRGDHE